MAPFPAAIQSLSSSSIEGIPFIVEAGIFLDLVAAVLIMVVFVSGITRTLAEATAAELRELRG